MFVIRCYFNILVVTKSSWWGDCAKLCSFFPNLLFATVVPSFLVAYILNHRNSQLCVNLCRKLIFSVVVNSKSWNKNLLKRVKHCFDVYIAVSKNIRNMRICENNTLTTTQLHFPTAPFFIVQPIFADWLQKNKPVIHYAQQKCLVIFWKSMNKDGWIKMVISLCKGIPVTKIFKIFTQRAYRPFFRPSL